MKIKKIDTFKEYLKEQKQQKINESNVSIEVDWWDQCIVEVLSDLEDECNGLLDWNVLSDFIKTKFSILGRTWDEYIDNLYILHIKDLIFQHHGQSFCVGLPSNDNSELHTKGVVIEQLAQVIYDKLSDKINNNGAAPDKAKVKVIDNEPAIMIPAVPVPVQDDVDVDWCDEGKQVKNVKKFAEYIKECTATRLKEEDSNACIEYCLNRIEREAGSLNPDIVFDAAVKYADGRGKARLVAMYVNTMVDDFLKNSQVVICNLDDTDDEELQQELIGDAYDTLIDRMTDDVLYALYKVNGGKDEKVK